MSSASAPPAAAPALARSKLETANRDRAPQRRELLLDRPLPAAHPPLHRLPWRPRAAARTFAKVGRFPGRYVAGLVEAILVALIALQCTTLFGVVATAAEPPRPGAPAQLASVPASTTLSSHDPFFGRADSRDVPSLAATGLELYGVRQDGRTGLGSAIISEAGGPQKSFGVGDTISPGVVLKEVGHGYATVARHGVDERLAFASLETPASRIPPPSTSSPSTPAISAGSARGPNRPPVVAPAGQAARSSSINFADPSTLPASLNPPAE